MAFDYVKIGTDVVVGGVLGAADRLIEKEDEDREDDKHKAGTLKATEKMPIMSRYGTYFNFIPLVGTLIGAAAGMDDNWTTRTVTAASELAGRKLTYNLTTKPRAIPASAWTVWERENKGNGQKAVVSGLEI